MAVFAWVSGDPFSYEMDETPFYDAVSDVSSDIFGYAADKRLWMMSIAYDSFSYRTENVRRWITHGTGEPISSIDDWLVFGAVAAMSATLAVWPYLNPWTAPVALVLDAYNIYRYFD